ncbi:CMD domain protein [Bosea sp. SSUT16]|jgi:CMD domain protein|uniref:CMD domain protein n=1 Tax=Bosea spartocytisi TaxID=2773451 RepID=A0A927HY63_9HYPH|nr:CMD domain protein [Bosea spartocytisi]MBD3844091.1 CMD domain protein [Bosea spartocytisi]MCT4470801.1 CMD domain protein [Bosea spartocytisi]
MTDHATAAADILDTLAKVSGGTHLDALRRERPQTRDNVQASYAALFEAGDTASVTLDERLAVAAFVALLHEDGPSSDHYLGLLRAQPAGEALANATQAIAERARTTGPYGAYPPGPLSSEDLAGPELALEPAERETLGERLAAALLHAHRLVFHPRDAQAQHLAALQQAGWSTAAIVTLSQIIAYLAFQIRAAHGLRFLGAAA